MNILLVKLSAIGDVVHTLPSLAALKACYPGAHVTWVIEDAASGLIENHPDCDRMLVSHRKRWIGNLRKGTAVCSTLAEIRTFLKALRDRRYDLAIDFHGLFKSAVIMGLARADRKIGYGGMQELSGLFYGERVFEDMNKHAVDRYLDFIAYLGFPVKDPVFSLALKDEEKSRTRALLQGRGIAGGDRFVAINTVALWKTKLWEDESFAKLADRIVSELGLKVVFTGGKDVVDSVNAILSLMKTEAVSLAGGTTLRELACLYEMAGLVVSTDSGPMHIAAAAGTPTVALFGPTDPARTGPYGEKHRVVRAGIACSPCFLKSCETKRCMKEITADAVFTAVKDVLRYS